MNKEIKEMLDRYEEKVYKIGKLEERKKCLDLFKEILKPYFNKKELNFIYKKYKNKVEKTR